MCCAIKNFESVFLPGMKHTYVQEYDQTEWDMPGSPLAGTELVIIKDKLSIITARFPVRRKRASCMLSGNLCRCCGANDIKLVSSR